ncbi:MAG: hypothetical protein L0216_21635 [Planctomycetales bacterium]|nr:hypothetical protein [Planctomycetales bacterium]
MTTPIRSAALALATLAGAGCITVPSETNDRSPDFAPFTDARAAGRKVALVAFSQDIDQSRDQWWRRKVCAMTEGLVLGVIPYPWDLRATYSPAPITLWSEFEAGKSDPAFGAKVREALEKRSLSVEGLDPKSAGMAGRVSVEKLVAMAREKGCEGLYVVAYNEFDSITFKNSEDTLGGVMQHNISTFEGSTVVPSTAFFRVGDGSRLLVRAREHERFFYAPLLSYGWLSPYHGEKGFQAWKEWFAKLASKDATEARQKAASYVVERDFAATAGAGATSAAPGPNGAGTPAKPDGAGAAEKPAEKPPEKPAEAAPPPEKPAEPPPAEKPPEEKPAEEKPPEPPPAEKPPEEKPPEKAPEEKPGEETPPGGGGGL